MPAAGWRSLADLLMNEAFHASTGRERKTHQTREGAPATRQALHKIERALAAQQTHPAMQGSAALGSFGDVLVAFDTPNGLSLYPVTDRLVFLVPYWAHDERVGDLTMWKAEPEQPPVVIPGLFGDLASHQGW